MSIGVLGRRGLLAGLTVLGVVCPAMVSADEIRILFVGSRDGDVEAQVRKLERAIRESQGPLAIAESLSEAQVAIQFIEYRRSITKKGEVRIDWVGQAKLLKQPEEMIASTKPLPERFGLLVIVSDGREEERTLETLGRLLRRTFRLRLRPPEKDDI